MHPTRAYVHIAQKQSCAGVRSRAVDDGCTVTDVSVDGCLVGYIVLSDTVRDESAGMIGELHRLNVEPMLLTGDNQNAATAIGKQQGIRELRVNCLPEDKLNHIPHRRISGQRRGDLHDRRRH